MWSSSRMLQFLSPIYPFPGLPGVCGPITLDDGLNVFQLKTQTYAKPTDVHRYIPPSSCTPNLSSKSPSIIKGVAHRLRMTNMLDKDLISALNLYSGYLEASGYDRGAILQHFNAIVETSNEALIDSSRVPDSSFKCPLVIQIHPALPDLRAIIKKYQSILATCPLASVIFPVGTFFPAYRKLPSLSTLLLKNPFHFSNSSLPAQQTGFFQSPDCRCKLCKEAHFCSSVASPALPGRGFHLSQHLNCRSQMVVYMIVCKLCQNAYIGQTQDPRQRWSSHKSHIRLASPTCNMATHCSNLHPLEMVGETKLKDTDAIRSFLQFTILERAVDESPVTLTRLEEKWRNNLRSWFPLGLNTRDDGPKELRKKKLLR